MRRARSARLLALAAAAAGCGGDRRVAEGDEPIAALQVAHVSQRYSTEYWQAQAAQQSAVWSVAVAVLRDGGARRCALSQLPRRADGGARSGRRALTQT